jgi:hypothetical protein
VRSLVERWALYTPDFRTTNFEKGAKCRPAWALELYKLKVRIDRSGRVFTR